MADHPWNTNERCDWFFTFGGGHNHEGLSLANRYVVMRDLSYADARTAMWKLRGAKWCCQYPLTELAEQVRNYGLTEITPAQLEPTP